MGLSLRNSTDTRLKILQKIKKKLAEAQKHYCLCDYNDIAGFHKALKNYVLYLDEIIPKLIIILKSEYKFKDEDLQFGYFCFEVHSE